MGGFLILNEYEQDTVGIVARLSECIASRGGNIHSVDVFVPDDKPVFYSRSEFTYNPMLWPRDVLRTDFLNLSQHFSAQRSTVRVPDLDPKYKISVLASKQVSLAYPCATFTIFLFLFFVA
jgi:formyltetrahydrofolate deformylase